MYIIYFACIISYTYAYIFLKYVGNLKILYYMCVCVTLHSKETELLVN